MKGLLAKNGNGNDLFRHLDVLFDIPQEEEKPKKSKEELIGEFETFLEKGA